MRVGRGGLLAMVFLSALAGCQSPRPVLPPIPATSGSLLVPPGSPPPATVDQALVDRVVAIVNEDVILMSELQEYLLIYLKEAKEPLPASTDQAMELQRKVLARMVNHRLQVQEARREKIEVSDGEVQTMVDDFVRRNGGDRLRIEAQLRAQGLTWEGLRREMRDQLLANKIRGRRIGRVTSATDAEVGAYVAANRGKVEAGLRYHPRHIAVLAEPPESDAAWAQAKAEIDEVAAQLRQGADFADLARTHSKDGSAAGGGDLGWLTRGEIQSMFEEAILKLKPGEVTEPIKAAAGYHLFRLDEREELTDELLAQLRQQARDILIQKKAQERLDEWVERLRQRALIAERL